MNNINKMIKKYFEEYFLLGVLMFSIICILYFVVTNEQTSKIQRMTDKELEKYLLKKCDYLGGGVWYICN